MVKVHVLNALDAIDQLEEEFLLNDEDEAAARERLERELEEQMAEDVVQKAVIAFQKGFTVSCDKHESSVSPEGRFSLNHPDEDCHLCNWILMKWRQRQDEERKRFYENRNFLRRNELDY